MEQLMPIFRVMAFVGVAHFTHGLIGNAGATMKERLLVLLISLILIAVGAKFGWKP